MRRLFIPAVLGLTLVACQDQAPDQGRQIIPTQALFSQVSHFFFLPPLGPANPPANGTFNGNLFPVVEICTLTGPQGTCTGPLLATFTRTSGTNNQLIVVIPNTRYQVEWSTSGLGLPNGTYARVTVRSAAGGGTVFGIADVYIDTDDAALANAPSQGAVGLRNGRGLPIRFIMEDGVLCENDAECFEGTIDSNGGTFTFPDGTAGIQAPAGAIKTGESANLIIERYHGPDPCLPTDFPQYESCLRVHVEGNITSLNSPVDVGFCLEAGAPDVAELEVQKWDEVDPATLKTVQTTDVSDFITCDSFSQAEPSNELARLARGAGRLLKPLASLFVATPAYASSKMAPGPIPFGAGLSDFSRIGVVRPLILQTVSGDNSSAPAGSSVTPTVQVTSKKTGAAVSGVHVKFTPTSGTGTVNPIDTFTDPGGLASTSWTLGAGSNVLRADAYNPKPGFPSQLTETVFANVTLNGTGTTGASLNAYFLPPVGSNKANTAKQVHALPVTVNVCLLDANQVCTSTTFGPFSAVDKGAMYETSWKTPKNLVIGAIYRITVSVGSTPLTGSAIDIQPLAGGQAKNLTAGTTFNFNVGSNLPLKFSIETP